MLMLESVDMNAANDVVREEQNLTENGESIQTREKLGSSTLHTRTSEAILTSRAKMTKGSPNP